MRQLSPLVAALLLFVGACSSGDGDGTAAGESTARATVVTAGPRACSPTRPASPGETRRTLSVGGVERSYLLHVPPGYDGANAVPLLVVFHGFSLNGESMPGYSLFGERADDSGFVVAYPDALGSPARWNTSEAVNEADDVAFGAALLDALETELCIDTNAVFVVGYSNGGGMAQRLACVLSNRVTALGTVAATYVECREAVPWIAFHGAEDPVVPFMGGENPPERGGGTFLDARRTLSDWSRELGCDPLGIVSRPADGVELTTFPNCLLGDGEVVLYTIIEGGHTWPGAYELPVETVGATSQQISATDAMWDFFVARGTQSSDPDGDRDAND